MTKGRKLRFEEAAAVAAVSALVVKFTDIGFEFYEGELFSTSWPWKIALCFSSASPWTLRNAFQYLFQSKTRPKEKEIGITSHKDSSKYGTPPPPTPLEDVHHSNRDKVIFMIHDLVHNFVAIAYHAYPSPFLAWLALINFPLWFSLIDRAITRKEMQHHNNNNNESTTFLHVTLFGKRNCIMQVNQDPLFLFALAIYVYGTVIRGIDYLISASCLVNLCLPFARRISILTEGIIKRGFVLGLFFLLEHLSIQYQLHFHHNIVHFISHYAIASFVNEIYVSYFDGEV